MDWARSERTRTLTFVKTVVFLFLLGVTSVGISASRADAATEDITGSSVLATWNCTGTPCPWNAQETGQAAVWPAAAEPTRARYGYTVSHDVYAPAAKVAGWKVTIGSGNASIYSGPVNGSHASVATLSAGQSFTLPSLTAGDIVSVQSEGTFQYTFTPGTAPTTPTTPTTPTPTTPTPTTPTTDPAGSSVLATWNCTGTPCPWNAQETGQAAVWPAAAEPTRARYGYTVSHDVYAPAAKVAGWKVTIGSGNASIYSGPVNGSHASVATLSAGQSFTLPSLTAGDIVSVQGGAAFQYTFTPGTAPTTPPTTTPTPTPTTPTTTPTTPTTDPAGSSVLATWNCTGTPCPWGAQDTGQAAVWPAAAEPTRARYGYTVSHDVYAPAAKVAGWIVTITSGNASIYSGPANGSHGAVAGVSAGQSFTVPSLNAGDIVSVQGGAPFQYSFTPGTPPPPAPSACIDPTNCDPVSWISARWRYTGPESNVSDWYGGVVTWPSWAAYSTNNRAGESSRVVYSEAGEKLYPYMGAWADGCKVKVVTGRVLIIEWQRGLDQWREKYLAAGDIYTIDLVGPEDGAMIETPNNLEPFTVSLSNCTPQRLDGSSTVNTAPVAAAGAAQSVSTGATVTLDGSGSRDADGNTLTYAWTQTAGPAVTLSSATVASPTFTAPATAGTFTFSLTVNDGKVNSPASTTTVTTTVANTAPVAAAGAAQSVSTGATVTLDGSGSRDADGNTLTYAWTQTAGPAVTLSSATIAKPTFTAPAVAGTFTFSLTVNDGKVNSPASTTTVTTTVPNTAPVAAAGAAQSVSTGSTVTLDGSGSRDADGNTLTYAWTQTGGPAVTLSSTTAVKPTFTAPATATALTFSLVVNDGKVNSPASTTTVTTTLPLNNVARGKTATQSSTALSAPASRAVDGNTDGTWSNNSVTHTNADAQAWWQVDLGSASSLSTVKVFNRTDCCGDRLNNGVVFISTGDMSGRTYSALQADSTVKKLAIGATAPAVATLDAAGFTGRYVKVQLPGTQNLHIAEVQVLQAPDITPPTISAVNASTSATAATVTWTTNESSTSVVQYGTSATSLTSTSTGSSGVTAHSVAVTGLTPGQQYYYQVVSADAAGNSATSPATASFTLPGGSAGNLAVGDTVTASSSVESGPWARAKAADGVYTSNGTSNGWSSSNSLTTNHTEYIQVDLGSSQSLKQVSLFPRSDAGNVGAGYPVNFTVATSTIGLSWTTVQTVTGAAQPTAAQHFAFAATTARYVRVTATSLRPNPTDGNQYRMQLAEIGVY